MKARAHLPLRQSASELPPRRRPWSKDEEDAAGDEESLKPQLMHTFRACDYKKEVEEAQGVIQGKLVDG